MAKSNTENIAIGFLWGLLIGVVLGIWLTDEVNYRAGQIHALTGKIEYELVTHPDSTRSWEKIDED